MVDQSKTWARVSAQGRMWNIFMIRDLSSILREGSGIGHVRRRKAKTRTIRPNAPQNQV